MGLLPATTPAFTYERSFAYLSNYLQIQLCLRKPDNRETGMNWDAIGAIGEIVGALAVLATLIYLAIQVRQNSELQRAQTHQQLAQERTLNMRMLIQDREVRHATAKAHFGKPLSVDEQGILYWFTILYLRIYENELYQHSKGMIEDEELAVQRAFLDLPHMQIEAVEAISLHTFTPKIQQLIRELSEKRKAAR
jgi:hypothetical protein